MKRFSLLLGAVSLSLWLGSAPALHAQAATPEQAAKDALALFDNGNFKDAVTAYENILKLYPTSVVVSEAQFRLGYAYFLTGEFDRSVETLRKTLGPPTPQKIQELGQMLLPKALAAKAGKLPKTDSGRTKAYEEAIRQYDIFIQKYPKNEEVEGANYGRGLCLLQIEKYADAAAALRANLTGFPRSETILDSQYLLALTLATDAVTSLRDGGDAARPGAMAKFDEAQKFLADIVQKRTDVALANDAQFQLGELQLNRSAFSDAAQKPALYAAALDAYRSVDTKEEMVKAQQARIDATKQRRIEALRRNDGAGYERLESALRREQAKLEEIKARGDTTVSAGIKRGTIYFFQGRPDESRVLLTHMRQFADDEQKKEILYYRTLTYSSQGVADKAVAGYDEFTAAHKADPMAEYLPVAIGQMFLRPGINDTEKAVRYFKAALEIYPKNRFATDILGAQAQASLMQGKFGDALKTYQQFLATKPRRDLEARAEAGIAEIYRSTNKTDDALKAYKKVRDTYDGLPEAEQAGYWVGALTAQKGDLQGALKEFDAFLKKHPSSELVPAAMFGIAQARLGTRDKPGALALFKEIQDKYPKSQVAPFCYFQRAQLLGGEGKAEDVVAEMKAFIKNYPEDDKLFFAYDSVGQDLIAKGKPLDAIASYEQMAGEQPKNARAPEALAKAADLWLKYLNSTIGRYLALDEQKRADWKKAVDSSIADGEKLVAGYPDSQQVAPALQTLLSAQKLLVQAKLATEADVEKYFAAFAEKFADRKGARSKVLFTLASYIYERDKDKALEQMKAAFDPKLVYAPADMDLYGGALTAKGRFDEATQVFNKLAADYPNPPGVDPGKAPLAVQEAQAVALFGIGKVLQEQKKSADAAVKFDLLKQRYPWSPKLLEANYGIAQSLIEKQDYEKATPLLVGVIGARTAPAELRANAMLLVARMAEQKNEIQVAIDNYAKIAMFYQGVPAPAAEGLYKAAELILTKQLATIPDEKKRAAQKAKAVKYLKDLQSNYASSPFAEKAKALNVQ